MGKGSGPPLFAYFAGAFIVLVAVVGVDEAPVFWWNILAQGGANDIGEFAFLLLGVGLVCYGVLRMGEKVTGGNGTFYQSPLGRLFYYGLIGSSLLFAAIGLLLGVAALLRGDL